MIETGNPDIDADQLTQRVRSEMRRHEGQLRRPPSLAAESDLYSRLYLPPLIMDKPFGPDVIRGYHVRDLLVYQHAHLVRNAYRAILGRKVDRESLDHWMDRLAGGSVSKIELLGRLRYSPEGRRAAVELRGLALPFALEMAGRLPVLGYLVRLALAMAKLPRMQVHVRQLESHLFRELESIKIHQNRLIERFNRLIAAPELGRRPAAGAEEQLDRLRREIDRQNRRMDEITRAAGAQNGPATPKPPSD